MSSKTVSSLGSKDSNSEKRSDLVDMVMIRALHGEWSAIECTDGMYC